MKSLFIIKLNIRHHIYWLEPHNVDKDKITLDYQISEDNPENFEKPDYYHTLKGFTSGFVRDNDKKGASKLSRIM